MWLLGKNDTFFGNQKYVITPRKFQFRFAALFPFRKWCRVNQQMRIRTPWIIKARNDPSLTTLATFYLQVLVLKTTSSYQFKKIKWVNQFYFNPTL
jgi:hypothetical protein